MSWPMCRILLPKGCRSRAARARNNSIFISRNFAAEGWLAMLTSSVVGYIGLAKSVRQSDVALQFIERCRERLRPVFQGMQYTPEKTQAQHGINECQYAQREIA